ncbi:hypothetical protein LX32DRAFT_418327 [Colletotrichum zoysiae]|uniref:Uncharacterized protein n=1 Tax=Colletotrichum zoysiae TaxID=1216348 RepID=A0AAD9M705_9PEZI|nr:hypothetical protein LX32DRAFT_418327 [Colletotrichum zoysiae]
MDNCQVLSGKERTAGIGNVPFPLLHLLPPRPCSPASRARVTGPAGQSPAHGERVGGAEALMPVPSAAADHVGGRGRSGAGGTRACGAGLGLTYHGFPGSG